MYLPEKHWQSSLGVQVDCVQVLTGEVWSEFDKFFTELNSLEAQQEEVAESLFDAGA